MTGLTGFGLGAWPPIRCTGSIEIARDGRAGGLGDSIGDEIQALSLNFKNYDFFYMHIKKTDSYGEDGDFCAKAGVIEEFDSLLPEITELGVDVLAVTGDHSTPSAMKAHSWHPVPLMISSKYCRGQGVSGFSESSCCPVIWGS